MDNFLLVDLTPTKPFGEPHERERGERGEAHEEERRAFQRTLSIHLCLTLLQEAPYIGGRGRPYPPHQGTPRVDS
jgi:hypothetical protein